MPGRSIQVVAGHTLSMTFVPKWFAEFHRRNGYFNARVLAANVQEAIIALAEGSCDLMIGYSHPRALINLDPDKFVGLRLGTDSFFPVSAPGPNGKPLFDLPGSPNNPVPYLAYTATSFLGRVVDVIIQAEKDQPSLKRFYEADMAMHLLRMAREGYGITWVPESAVEDEIAAGKLVRIGGDEWTAELDIWSFRSISNTNQTMLGLWQSLEKDFR